MVYNFRAHPREEVVDDCKGNRHKHPNPESFRYHLVRQNDPREAVRYKEEDDLHRLAEIRRGQVFGMHESRIKLFGAEHVIHYPSGYRIHQDKDNDQGHVEGEEEHDEPCCCDPASDGSNGKNQRDEYPCGDSHTAQV
mmetsp:Transcript_112702/g.211372  ORF Transcript_112702/g.211372 Transcript_112702/m.211372 type:complete len:138 (-) Transcript_112702:580-993(-)